MKILIFSDTHGNFEDPIEIIKNEPEVNAIIHAGDVCSDAEKIRNTFINIPVYSVSGNCDIYSNEPINFVTMLAGKKVLITHGHKYYVKSGMSTIKEAAQKENFDLVIFGHTHKSTIEYFANAILVNPGTMSGNNKSYAVAQIENGNIKVKIIEF